ncbi:MAG: hypothetical protein ACXAEI_12475 [Candidatus Hodarchaeales archaeon]
MIIHIELMAIIKRPNDIPRVFSKEFDNNQLVVKALLEEIGFSPQDIKLLQVFVTRPDSSGNATRVPRNYALKNNDKVFITIPVGGG